MAVAETAVAGCQDESALVFPPDKFQLSTALPAKNHFRHHFCYTMQIKLPRRLSHHRNAKE